jgi:hypothetical protein
MCEVVLKAHKVIQTGLFDGVAMTVFLAQECVIFLALFWINPTTLPENLERPIGFESPTLPDFITLLGG